MTLAVASCQDAASGGVEMRAIELVQSRELLAERRLEALQGVELVVEAPHLGVLLASSPGVAALGGVALCGAWHALASVSSDR